MKRYVLIGMLVLSLSGCAGRAANPVMVRQYNDHNKSCLVLEREMAMIETDIQHLVPKTNKMGTNTALGVAGAFFVVPLLFMDFTYSEQIEINAFRERYNHLAILAMEKGCESDRTPIELPKEEKAKDATKDAISDPA